ncbi:hypothetical protein ABE41_006575 [Fictibacillus arsenicus]|uniref:DNA 3'-5' helicase n=1 Tax=Fictibacillus arsenicus TaxID=255247 RepID=A0A1B1Z2H8_9BACL|nr:UvrD-helicase domain-containing protein [Fictibacillus arsenicus]ANX11667.1 hypothetical protein ABE41_006575 [Fictibacillus arsenicus]
MGAIEIFKGYLNRVNLYIYSAKIKKHIRQLEKDIFEINGRINKIERSPTLVSENYFINYLNDHQRMMDYVKSENVYSFDNAIQQRIMNVPRDNWPASYRRLELVYNQQSEKYLYKLDELKSQINKTNQKLKAYYDGIVSCLVEIERMKKNYISYSLYTGMLDKYRYIYSYFKDAETDNEKVQEFLVIYSSCNEDNVKKWNEEFVTREMAEEKDFFSDIDGKELDKQQKWAVIIDEDANLIIAGAGSGKTLTISGKVKYLVEKKRVSPNDILLVSFTKKAAKEMEERIKERLNINVDVKTFHKIGIGIITAYSDNKPDVESDPKKIIKDYFNQEFYDNPEQLKRMIEFFGYYLHIPKDLEEFNNLGECYDYHKHLDFETLKSKYEDKNYINENTEKLKQNLTTISGEKVKSLEEVMIANFLFLNGVEYEYEKDYEYVTSDQFHRQYKPDFYLPEYDIYIEHFGITKDNRTPWLSEIDEIKYIKSMEWKRELHNEKETNLIETYSYLTKEGRLLETLRKKLLEQGVIFIEVDIIDISNKIYDTENGNHFGEFIKFVSSFINLFKSNGYDFDQFETFIKILDKGNSFFYNRTRLFLEITKPIYRYYQSQLKQHNLIDFNDMINRATSIVKAGEINFSYKYIIIDEYQDISVSRYKLIQEIRDRTKAKVMCVGDDWQSIYRFAGSDLNLFTDFEKYFGRSELMKIEKTYRNSQELINVAGNFVMRNKKQIKKNLVSGKNNDQPLRIFGYTGENEKLSSLKHLIEQIVNDYGPKAQIMLLGRNNFDIKFVDENDDFDVKNTKDNIKVTYKKYPELDIFFLTAHRSKGLESDNVIIINTSNSLLGFPNRVADDPILSLVITSQDELELAEERRLFYVALTRTKNVTYVLTPDLKMSVFIKELIDTQGIEYEILQGNTTITNNPNCPKCVQGYLKIRVNGKTKKEFLGCSNYPNCEYRLNDTSVIHNKIECKSCKGYMVVRKSKRGPFYGCSNYPHCTQIMDIVEKKKLVR